MFDVCSDYVVLDYLVKNPYSYPRKISKGTGVHVSAVQARLKLFKELGLVDLKRDLRHALYYVTEKGMKYYEALKVVAEIHC